MTDLMPEQGTVRTSALVCRGWPPAPDRSRDAPAAHPAYAEPGRPPHQPPRMAVAAVTARPAGQPSACPPSLWPSRLARLSSAAARSSRSPGPAAAATPPTRPATPRSTQPARPAGPPARPPKPPTPHTRASPAARTPAESNMIKQRTPAPTRRRSAGGLTGYHLRPARHAAHNHDLFTRLNGP